MLTDQKEQLNSLKQKKENKKPMQDIKILSNAKNQSSVRGKSELLKQTQSSPKPADRQQRNQKQLQKQPEVVAVPVPDASVTVTEFDISDAGQQQQASVRLSDPERMVGSKRAQKQQLGTEAHPVVRDQISSQTLGGTKRKKQHEHDEVVVVHSAKEGSVVCLGERPADAETAPLLVLDDVSAGKSRQGCPVGVGCQSQANPIGSISSPKSATSNRRLAKERAKANQRTSALLSHSISGPPSVSQLPAASAPSRQSSASRSLSSVVSVTVIEDGTPVRHQELPAQLKTVPAPVLKVAEADQKSV